MHLCLSALEQGQLQGPILKLTLTSLCSTHTPPIIHNVIYIIQSSQRRWTPVGDPLSHYHYHMHFIVT